MVLSNGVDFENMLMNAPGQLSEYSDWLRLGSIPGSGVHLAFSPVVGTGAVPSGIKLSSRDANQSPSSCAEVSGAVTPLRHAYNGVVIN